MIPHRYATIMSGLVIRWRFPDTTPGSAEINASRDGVSISGAWPIMKDACLDEVCETLDQARAAYRRLREGDEMPEIPSAPIFFPSLGR